MHASFKSILIAAVFFASISSSFAGNMLNESEAKPQFNVSFLDQNSHRVVVNIANQDNEQIQLKVLDENGKPLHVENIQGNGIFSKRYSFSELNNGIYALEIEKSGNKFVHAVVLK